jgi:protein-tyrosine phosphatase
LLVVCTANVCRSPLAARSLARAFEGQGWLGTIELRSAGTRAEDGWTMCPVSDAQLPGTTADRVFADEHRSRRLSSAEVQNADLVIAMEREQRSAIARLAPGSQAKVYTLREVEGLLAVLLERGGEPPADLPALAQALHSVRGFAVLSSAEPSKRRWYQRPVEPEDPLTIVDGHGLGEERHLAAVEQVAATSERVAAAIRRIVSPR